MLGAILSIGNITVNKQEKKSPLSWRLCFTGEDLIM